MHGVIAKQCRRVERACEENAALGADQASPRLRSGLIRAGYCLASVCLCHMIRITIMESTVIPGGAMRTMRTVVLVIFAGIMIPCQGSSAQEQIRRVTLAQALQDFAENSRELQIAQSEWSEAAGLARQLRAYSNPAFSMVREDLGYSGEDYWEVTVGIIQRVEWPGRTSARYRAAGRTIDAATARLRADSLRLAFKVCEAYLQAWMAEEAELIVRRAASVLATVVDAAERRLAEGDIADYEARRLRLEGLQADQEAEKAAHRARTARMALAGLISPADEGHEVGPSEAPGQLPTPLMAPVVLEALAQRPDVVAAARELDAAKARTLVSATEWVPAPTVSLGYKDHADGFSGAAMALSLPLPVFDHGTGTRASASARESAAAHRLDLTRRLAAIDLRTASDRYASARNRLEATGDVMLADAEALLATAQSAYAEGEMTVLELLDAAKAFRDARLSAVSLRYAAWLSYYDLLRAMGRKPETDR